MRRISVLAIPLLLPAFAAGAESAYVAQSQNIGIHEAATLQSTILKLVPSGTELEILERDEQNRVRVRLKDGVEGWVDGQYLRDGIPPARRVTELEDELLQTATELARARDQVAELEFELSKSRAEAAALVAGMTQAAAKTTGSETLTSDTLRELQNLAEENQRLKQRVAELEAVQTMAIERVAEVEQAVSGSPQPEAAESEENPALLSRYTAIVGWPLWKKILLTSAILLAFAVGCYLVDWDVRRRHGGFRV
ncbi:MAG: TIGR04211 family SH3 domain-containing protein [Gammaproteobacteria bacterium]|nr:TIGR04211 family SH3 domain-containing protein [Gammaproteobacteria bacterium]